MPKKITIKPRNAGTMTESAFWGMIRSGLRRLSMYWKPIGIVKQQARRQYKGPNKRQKREYQCNKCKKRFPDKIGKKSQIQIDHIQECGEFNKQSAGEFIERMFCEVKGFQCLCSECHTKKTNLARKK